MLTLLEMTLAGFESMPHNHTIFSSSRFQPLANHPGLRADAPGRATEHTGTHRCRRTRVRTRTQAQVVFNMMYAWRALLQECWRQRKSETHRMTTDEWMKWYTSSMGFDAAINITRLRDFPDGPVARTPSSWSRGPRFGPPRSQLRVCKPPLNIPHVTTKMEDPVGHS